MARYVFDIETDGLLDTCTKLHCIVLRDLDTDETFTDVKSNLQRLSEAEEIVGHNIISFDLPALQKIFPGFTWKGRVVDTLVLSKLVYANVKDWDGKLLKKGKLPGKMFGRHSLEAWGYRLGHPKVGTEIEDWSTWTPEMQARCENDVNLNSKLYARLREKGWPEMAGEIEHDVAWLCSKIERNGIHFDTEKAANLYSVLAGKREELQDTVKSVFEPWYVYKGVETVNRTARIFRQSPDGSQFRTVKDKASGRKIVQQGWYESREEGAKYSKVELTEFNPGSRHHIVDRLKHFYGWEPVEYTEKGHPKVDDSVLNGLPYPEAQTLAEYFLIQKRISQLAEGDEAWLLHERNGKIHGKINPNGTRTGRGSHSSPNLGQVPAVGKPYGQECRELFYVPEGWDLVGVDLSGIELRCLAHYLGRYDNGAYIEVVLNGDPHTRHQEAALLETRGMAKTFGYAYIYGAGDPKLGSIAEPHATSKKWRTIGKQRRALFQKAITGLDELQDDLKIVDREDGYIRGLDGRKLYSPSTHTLLNTLLQSAGALIAKVWIILTERELLRRGYKHGWDGDFAVLLWVHDEQQIACRPEIREEVKEVALWAARKAGEFFNLRIRIDAEAKHGRNWAETH